MPKKAKKGKIRVDPSSAICTVSFDEAVKAAQEYRRLGEMEDDLKKRRDECKSVFGEFAKAYGRDNGKGSLYFQSPDGYFIGLQRRQGRRTFDPEKAREFFTKRGLLKRVLTEIVDEGKIALLLATGDIDEDDILQFTTEAEPTFAASVLSQEKMEKYGSNEIEETAFSLN